MSAPVLAVDFGGTRIKCGLVAEGAVRSSRTMAAQSGAGLAAALPRVAAALREICVTTGVVPDQCAGIACAVPALVDHRWQRVRNAYGKYADAPGVDLPSWANEAFRLPLLVENDARLALIGEWRHGAGRGLDDAIMITLGTGIGTAVLMGGRPLRGADGRAGNLGGHLIAVADGRPCSCGSRGCYESETGSAQLDGLARASPDFAASSLGAGDGIDYRSLRRAARRGDACATALLERSLRLWARLCCDLTTCYGCRHVLVGGGVVAGDEDLLPELRRAVAALEACSIHPTPGGLDLRPAADPERMALLGAEWLLAEACFNPT